MLAAVGGQFSLWTVGDDVADRMEIGPGNRIFPASATDSGVSQDCEWIPDKPTLLAGYTGGIKIYSFRKEGLTDKDATEKVIEHTTSFKLYKGASRLAVGLTTGAVRVLNVDKGQSTEVKVSNEPITAITVNKSDQYALCGSAGGRLDLISLVNLRASAMTRCKKRIRRLMKSPNDMRLVACASEDGSLRIFDVSKREEQLGFAQAHSAPCTDIAFTPGQNVVVSTGFDKKFVCYDIRSKRAFDASPVPGLAASVDIHPDNRKITVGTLEGHLVVTDIRKLKEPLYQVSSGTEIRTVRFYHGPNSDWIRLNSTYALESEADVDVNDVHNTSRLSYAEVFSPLNTADHSAGFGRTTLSEVTNTSMQFSDNRAVPKSSSDDSYKQFSALGRGVLNTTSTSSFRSSVFSTEDNQSSLINPSTASHLSSMSDMSFGAKPQLPSFSPSPIPNRAITAPANLTPQNKGTTAHSRTTAHQTNPSREPTALGDQAGWGRIRTDAGENENDMDTISDVEAVLLPHDEFNRWMILRKGSGPTDRQDVRLKQNNNGSTNGHHLLDTTSQENPMFRSTAHNHQNGAASENYNCNLASFKEHMSACIDGLKESITTQYAELMKTQKEILARCDRQDQRLHKLEKNFDDFSRLKTFPLGQR